VVVEEDDTKWLDPPNSNEFGGKRPKPSAILAAKRSWRKFKARLAAADGKKFI
jgi:hypothetical protein